MAYEISPYGLKITLVAAADLSALQYTFVKLDSTGKAAACSALTDKPIGVLQNSPAAGQEAEVVVIGGTKVKAGAAITEGAAVKTSAAGLAIPLTVGTDITHYLVGQCLVEVAASGEITTAVINCASAGRGV